MEIGKHENSRNPKDVMLKINDIKNGSIKEFHFGLLYNSRVKARSLKDLLHSIGEKEEKHLGGCFILKVKSI